jgi:hypothetical protein
MRPSFFFASLSVLAALAGVAHAETIPATGTTRYCNYVFSTKTCVGGGGYTIADPESVALASANGCTPREWGWYSWVSDQLIDSDGTPVLRYRCCSFRGCGWSVMGTWRFRPQTTYACPETGGWTLQGAVCTRPDTDGVCRLH